MPYYKWVRIDTIGSESDEVCIEVIRKFDDYEQPPTNEEYPEAEKYEWRRVLGNFTLNKPWHWGSKGNW